MTDDEKMMIRSCFYQYVITDIYPEISAWEMEELAKKECNRIFNLFIKSKPKPDISPYKAWMDGFKFAQSLVVNRIELL